MPAHSIKNTIHELIDKVEDEELLNAYLKILQRATEEDSRIVGYTAQGEVLTPSMVKDKARAASERVKSGDYLSHDEVKKESEKW